MLALFSCPKEVSITPYLSKEQIAAAREMDLLTYLRRFEPEELVHIGGDTYATRTHDSLKISNGKWCWWSRGIGGTTALDYLTMVEGGSFLDAVQRILGEPLHVPPKSEPIAPLPKTEFTLPPKHADTRRVFAYLRSRGIDAEIINHCIKHGQLYVINGSNYVRLRDIGKAVGFEVYWDGDAKCVQVESGKPYTGIAPVKAETSGPASQPEATTPADDVDAMKQDIVDRTNALRREKGVAALCVNDRLMQAAQVRADEMATHTVYSHTRPDGRKFNTATDCPYMAENIHRIADWVLSDQTLAERAVADWSASTTHNKNMVNPKLSEIGVGLARGVNDTGDPCWYCVQLFLYDGYSITRVDTPTNK